MINSPTAAEQNLLTAINTAEHDVTGPLQAVEAERTGDALARAKALHDRAAELINDARAEFGDTSGAHTEGGTKTGDGDPPAGN